MEKDLKKDSLKAIFLLVLLSILSYTLPIFSLLIYIIWPIPIVYIITKYDINKSIYVIVLVAILNTFFVGLTIDIESGIIMGMNSIVGFGLIGFFLGSALKERFSPFKTLISTILGVLISNLVIFYSLPYVLNFNYQQMLSAMVDSIKQSSLAEYSFLIEQSIYIMRLLFPSLILISSIVMGILIYYVTMWYMERKGMKFPSYKPFKFWSFPRWWITLAILLTLLVRTYWHYSISLTLPNILNVVILNSLVLLFFLVFLQGFAVMIYYLSKKKSTLLSLIFIFFLFFFNIILFYILAFIGFIDMWFNLREERTR